jgi:hypothetical protein
VLKSNTPPPPTVTFCVILLYPPLPPIWTRIFWMAPNCYDCIDIKSTIKICFSDPVNFCFPNTKMPSNICNVLFYFSIWLFSSSKCPLFYWHKFVKGFLLRTLFKFWTNKSMRVFISWANIFLPPMFANKINRF